MEHPVFLGILFQQPTDEILTKFTFSGNLDQSQMSGFPLGLENLENLEKWEGIFQSGKSPGILNRLEKSGKITQNTGKFRESLRQILFVIF